MELLIPRDGDRPYFAKVKNRLREKDGLPIGRAHNIPILDTRMYKVGYKDRKKYLPAANKIAKNMFAQLCGEVNRHVLF